MSTFIYSGVAYQIPPSVAEETYLLKSLFVPFLNTTNSTRKNSTFCFELNYHPDYVNLSAHRLIT